MIMRIKPWCGDVKDKKKKNGGHVQGQKKARLRGTDDVLVVGLHMIGKMEVSSLNNNVTSFLTLYLIFTW
jgi:hypothetical protein